MKNYRVHFSSLKRRGHVSIVPARAHNASDAIAKARGHFAEGVKVYPVKVEELV